MAISKHDLDANLVIGSKKFWETTGRQEHLGITWEMDYFVRCGHDGLLKRKEESFENIDSCPLCASVNIYFFLERQFISVFRCEKCGFAFQNPRLRDSVAREIYKNEKTSLLSYECKAQKDIDAVKYLYGYEKIKQALSTDMDVILDIGCGNGLSLDVALKAGWKKAIGIEPNRNYKHTKKRGKIVRQCELSFFDCDDRAVNAITAWDVMEHINEPGVFLSRIKNMLVPGGVFLVMVPNLESLASRLFRERSSTFYWGHVNYFTKSSLESLFEQTGFEVVESETVISEIGNINNYLAFQDPYTGNSEDKYLFDFLTPDFVHNNFLGSRLLVIARLST